MKKNRFFFVAVICLMLILSCKHEPQYTIINQTPLPTNCDTTNVTYSGTIVPILNANCTVCHGATSYATSGGGFKIANYTDFVGFAKSGLMMNSLNGTGGLNSMPKGGNKLSACDIAKVRIVVRKILDSLNTTLPPPVSKCSPDTVYFTNTLGPLILNSCGLTTSKCHNTGGNSPLLTTYANIRANVVPGSPSSSRIYTVLSATGENAMPRSPVASFTAAQKLLVYNWIMQGAKNNSCVDAACDTTTVTYSGIVAPIFSTNCIGCHSSSGTSTTKLDSYTGAKAAVTAGRIIGAIQHSTGFTAMPPGGQLSACDIGKIKAWIYRGALNN